MLIKEELKVHIGLNQEFQCEERKDILNYGSLGILLISRSPSAIFRSVS